MTFTLGDLERDVLPTLEAYCAIPALSPHFDPEWSQSGYLERALHLLSEWVGARLSDAEVRIERLEGRTPLMWVDVPARGTDQSGTVVLYGHADKQPPLGEWSEGLAPFNPVRRGNRLYARGAVDDGYATFAAVCALEEARRLGESHPRCVLLIEASEESGSPDLEAYLDHFGDRLGEISLMICLDSGALSYDRLWVTSSLRGLVNVDVTVRVLERAQHSGTASGVVPSSFRLLRQLLDRVEDATTGDILLPEAHCPIPDWVRHSTQSIADEFGDVVAKEIPSLEGLDLMGRDAADRLLRRTWVPALSVIGLAGAPEPAQAGNVLRTSTTATLSLRLPPLVDASEVAAALVEVLTATPPAGAEVDVVVSSVASGWASSQLPAPLVEVLNTASTTTFGGPLTFTGEGGTIPFLFQLGRRFPAVPFVATGVLGPESNAHGIDEMLNLDAMVHLINALAYVLSHIGGHP